MAFTEKKSEYPLNDFRSKDYKGRWQKLFIDKYVDSVTDKGVEQTLVDLANDKNEHLPTSLFKFFPPTSYGLISLQENKLWLAPPSSFNDPFDSFACIEKDTYAKLYLLREIKRANFIVDNGSDKGITTKEYWQIRHSWSKEEFYMENKIPPSRQYFSKVLNTILEPKNYLFKIWAENTLLEAYRTFSKDKYNIRDVEYRVTCFSDLRNETELGKNTTMWSHYADHHRGFCIKYSLSNLSESVRCGLYPVQYSSNVPKISVRELLKVTDRDKRSVKNSSILKTILKSLVTKSKFWNYEREWRLIIENDRSDILDNNNIAFPHVESIYLGCRIEQNLMKFIVGFAEKHNIEIFQARQNDERFVLDFFPVNKKSLRDENFYKEMVVASTLPDPEGGIQRDRIFKKYNS